MGGASATAVVYVTSLWGLERELRAQGLVHIAGVDEAGRGTLAGPVVAAAVMLPAGCRLPGLADSKRLTARQRERLFGMIQRKALCVGVGAAEAEVVDQLNVLRATHLAMREAISQLAPPPEMLLVDGRRLPGAPVSQRALVGGDRLCGSIAAASIIAKVTRDRVMMGIDARYPGYGFARHKGYGTREHLCRLRELGPCPVHRLTFAPLRALRQASLPLADEEGP